MAGIKLEFRGADLAVKNIEKKISKINSGVRDELNAWAELTARKAKDYAPTDEGNLKGSINPSYAKLSKMEAGVTVGVNYAAYVEFGTRKYGAAYVSRLPQDWRDLAAQYKGKDNSGTFDEMIQNIMAWVLRNGIGAQKTKSGNVSKSLDSFDDMQQAAYWIAINILQNGIKPHPFLYPAYNETKDGLLENIKEVING